MQWQALYQEPGGGEGRERVMDRQWQVARRGVEEGVGLRMGEEEEGGGAVAGGVVVDISRGSERGCLRYVDVRVVGLGFQWFISRLEVEGVEGDRV